MSLPFVSFFTLLCTTMPLFPGGQARFDSRVTEVQYEWPLGCSNEL